MTSFFQYENVCNQRSKCACLIAYAVFFRCSELLNIRCSDVAFQKSHMSIFIETSKTDIYRDGQRVVIARSNSRFIPVKKFEMFFSWCWFIEDCTEDCTNFIFCNLSKTKSRHKLRNRDKALKYIRMQELFIEVFQGFVPDISIKKKTGYIVLGQVVLLFLLIPVYRMDCSRYTESGIRINVFSNFLVFFIIYKQFPFATRIVDCQLMK